MQCKSLKMKQMRTNLTTYYHQLSVINYRLALTFVLLLALALSFPLTLQAQTTRQLKVYLKGGIVDKVRVNANSPIRHSCIDLNGEEQEDYVTMVVTDAEGNERQHAFAARVLQARRRLEGTVPPCAPSNILQRHFPRHVRYRQRDILLDRERPHPPGRRRREPRL